MSDKIDKSGLAFGLGIVAFIYAGITEGMLVFTKMPRSELYRITFGSMAILVLILVVRYLWRR